MAKCQYFDDFKLIDKETGVERKLSDFGGIVYNPNKESFSRNLLPDPNHITSKDENSDGEQYVKTVYGTRIIEVPVYFSEDLGGGELFELNRWIGKKKQQIFQWVDDEERKEIDVVYKEGFDMDVLFGEKFNGLATFSFIAHNPYWRIRDERPLIYKNLHEGQEILINNKGNDECFPLFEIESNGKELIFELNGLEVSLKELDKPFNIDCENERCYEVVDGVMKQNIYKYKSDKYNSFPSLQVEKRNILKIKKGSISKLKIKLNTRII